MESQGFFSKAYSSLFGPSSPLTNQDDKINYEHTLDFNRLDDDITGNTTIPSTPRFNIYPRLSKSESDPFLAKTKSAGFESRPSLIPTTYSNGDTRPRRTNLSEKYKKEQQKKSVGWGENQFRERTRSSDIMGSTLSPPANIVPSNNQRYIPKDILPKELFFDSDDELNQDIDFLLNSKDRTETLLKTNTGLPNDYPGKFPSPYKPKYREIAEEFKKNELSDRLQRVQSYNSDRRSFSAQSDHKFKLDEKDLALRTAELNTYLNKLGTGNGNGQNIDNLIGKIEGNNDFLRLLMENLDLEEKEKEKENIESKSSDFVSRASYDKLNHEYIQELKNSEKIYEAYEKLIHRYRQLKQSQKEMHISSFSSLGTNKATSGYRASVDQDYVNELLAKIAILEADKKQLERKNFELREFKYTHK